MVGHSLDPGDAGWPSVGTSSTPLLALRTWMRNLFTQGYINTAGVFPILDPSHRLTNTHGEVQGGHRRWLTRFNGPRPRPGEENQYDIFNAPCKSTELCTPVHLPMC